MKIITPKEYFNLSNKYAIRDSNKDNVLLVDRKKLLSPYDRLEISKLKSGCANCGGLAEKSIYCSGRCSTALKRKRFKFFMKIPPVFRPVYFHSDRSIYHRMKIIERIRKYFLVKKILGNHPLQIYTIWDDWRILGL